MKKNFTSLLNGISTATFSMAERQLWIAFWAVPTIGLKSFWQCMWTYHHFTLNPEEFWENKFGIWDRCSLTEKQQLSIKKFKKEHNFIEYNEQLRVSGIQVLFFSDASYPTLLKNTDGFPPVLFIKSRQSVTHLHNALVLPIAVVGTRHMTSYGDFLIERFVSELVEAQASIISGFMYGVDFAAQKRAVTLNGKSIAVLGYGFQYCFPRSQQLAMTDFLEQGAIFMSEYAPEVAPHPGNFVQRNRIIAGLALGTLVIEAATKSGSHITANFAAEFGRLVFTIPGPITNPYSEGTKVLLKNGAIPVTSAKEILEEFNADYHLNLQLAETTNLAVRESPSTHSASHQDLPAVERRIIQLLAEQGSLNFNQLLGSQAWPAHRLSLALLELETTAQIRRVFDRYCLVKTPV